MVSPLSDQEEAMKIWKYLEPMIDKKIQSATASAVRRKKFTVVRAPNGSTMGVQEAGSAGVANVPYVSSLSTAAVGSTVWCEWSYGMSNMIAVSSGKGL